MNTKRGRVISLVLWSIVSLIWVGLTVSKIVSGGETWEIVMNALVSVLSITNVVLAIVFWKKK